MLLPLQRVRRVLTWSLPPASPAEADAVVPLTDLLVSADTTSQVCAAGALLNLLGPAVSDTEDPADPGRVALRRLLADGIALGAIAECLREPASGTAVVALKK